MPEYNLVEQGPEFCKKCKHNYSMQQQHIFNLIKDIYNSVAPLS